MDPLEQLRARIADFPGYDDDLARRRSDELVRSYLGEALATLAARCAPLAPELQARVDMLLLRVGFADPKSFGAHNGFAGAHDETGEADVAADDAATVALTDRASSVAAGDLTPYLDEVGAVLDRREAAMRAAAASPGKP